MQHCKLLLLLCVLPRILSGIEPATSGHLVLIGGGDRPADAMRKFIELAGGPAAPIVIIPTASTEPDAATYYEKHFREVWHCTRAVSLPIRSRKDAGRPDYVKLASEAQGVFFGGGDQIRITGALIGTPVGDALARAHAKGAVIGGTSAGTACQSKIMLTGEGDFKVIRSRAVEVWDGMGFLPDGVVVDQHFVARQRENRLLSVILEHPGHLGVGVDEETAIWVKPDGTFEVLGERGVMVFDPAAATVTRRTSDNGQDNLGVRGLRVHHLLKGDIFDLKSRTVRP